MHCDLLPNLRRAALGLVLSLGLSFGLSFALALGPTPASAQPLASDAGSDQLEALESARQALEQRFAALAFDEGSWSAYQMLCQTCQADRPQARDLAPDLPQDPLGPLDLAQLQARVETQRAAYEDALWQQSGISPAALARYLERCTDCRSKDQIAKQQAKIARQQQAWLDQRKTCQSAAAPRQYQGSHRWHQDRAVAIAACQKAWTKAPDDPWTAFLLWRSQESADKDPQLLRYAVEHAVPPALAAAAWQSLASPPHDMARAQRLAEAARRADDLNGIVISALILDQQGGSDRALMERLQPALDQDHPWALQIAADLETLPALKIAYLGLAAQQGDPRAQDSLLHAWEKNLSGSRLRKQAARAHIAAVVQGQALAKSLWFDRGSQRPQRLVKAVQGELIGLGLLSGQPDGVWGKNSEGALRKVTRAMVKDWILIADSSNDNEDEEELAAAAPTSASLPANTSPAASDGSQEAHDAEGKGYESSELQAASGDDPDAEVAEGDALAEANTQDAHAKPAPALLASAQGQPAKEEAASTEASMTESPADASNEASYAPETAPLPQPKGELALVDSDGKQEEETKKRGTVFKRKP